MADSKEESFSTDRLKWYQVIGLVDELAKNIQNNHSDPADLVHIGGIAFALRMRQAFEGAGVPWFRGTHDADIILFNSGL